MTVSQLPKLSVLVKPLAIRRLIRFRARFAGVVGKLKISPSGAVPFCDCDIVLINSIEQAALGLQKGILSNAVFKRRDQTAGNIFPDGAGTLLRCAMRMREIFRGHRLLEGR